MTRKSRDAPVLPTVQLGWLFPFLEVLAEHGVASGDLLTRAHLPVVALDDSSSTAPTARVWDFVALAARELSLDDLGLRAGECFEAEASLPDREQAWRRPGTFRSVTAFVEAALETSSNTEMWVEPSSDGLEPELCYIGTFGPEHEAFATIEQFMLSVMMRWLRFAAGPAWSPKTVHARARALPATIRALVGDANVHTGRDVTSIALPQRPFTGPVEPFPHMGSTVWRRHRRAVENPQGASDFVGSMRLVLRSYLPDGNPTLPRAARLTGLSVRTLQRRLEGEGTSYSELLEDLRHDLALYLLRDPTRRAAGISQELGYRDPAIFTRAFRRWTGDSPSAYRRALVLRRDGVVPARRKP